MTDTLTAPGILSRAADILAAQGWTREQVYEFLPYLPPAQCPVDLSGALALAAGLDISTSAVDNPTGVFADAVMLLAQRVLGDWATDATAARALDELTSWQDEDAQTADQVIAALRDAAKDSPVYPAPGSRIPDMPGYVVATCGHRVAGSEWRAGFRTCERCPSGPLDRYADAVVQALSTAQITCHPPRVGSGISIELPDADAALRWSSRDGWWIHGRGPRREQINTRDLPLGLVPLAADVAVAARSWLDDPNRLPGEHTKHDPIEMNELDELLDSAAQSGRREAGR